MTSSDFKVGDSVKLRLDNYIFQVCIKDGIKLLRMPMTLAWFYLEPLDWNDVIKLNP
jgi:hypothetical protein